MKMQIKNSDGTSTVITPRDERYPLMQQMTQVALRNMVSFIVYRAVGFIWAAVSIVGLLTHNSNLAVGILVIVLGLGTLVAYIINRHHRSQVKRNSQIWRERFGTANA